MYKFKVERDQQQTTSVTFASQGNVVIVRCNRIQPVFSHQLQNKLLLDFYVHQNHDQQALWSALEHNLKMSFDDIAATERMPTSGLKCHIFVLNQNQFVQSAIFNAVWLAFLLHGVPLHQSVFMLQWEQGNSKGKAIFDLHQPQSPLSGDYNSPPASSASETVKSYKSEVLRFLEHEWSS